MSNTIAQESPKTKFVNNKPPFKQPRRKPSPPAFADVSQVEICDDPLPEVRATPGSKYEPVFERMKVGQAIACRSEDVGKIANGMKKWIDRKGLKDHVIRTTKAYECAGDLKGRVWLLYVGPKGGVH